MNARESEQRVDLLVLGAGPAGHKAAIQGAKAGKHVLIVDRDPSAGGECVQRGTIPSKTLRESACYLLGLRARSEGVFDVSVPAQTKVAGLMRRLKAVRASHERYLGDQLARKYPIRLPGESPPRAGRPGRASPTPASRSTTRPRRARPSRRRSRSVPAMRA